MVHYKVTISPVHFLCQLAAKPPRPQILTFEDMDSSTLTSTINNETFDKSYLATILLLSLFITLRIDNRACLIRAEAHVSILLLLLTNYFPRIQIVQARRW